MTDHSQPLAARTSWKTLPCPVERATLSVVTTYSAAEFEQIKVGLTPAAMEDKWFIFFEEPWLYFHRSWTGSCVYGVRLEPSFEGVKVAESWVSRDTKQHRGHDVRHEERVLTFLIDALLLKKAVAFPVPSSAAGTPEGIYQHSVIGRGFPEVQDVASERPMYGLWQRIRGHFK